MGGDQRLERVTPPQFAFLTGGWSPVTRTSAAPRAAPVRTRWTGNSGPLSPGGDDDLVRVRRPFLPAHRVRVAAVADPHGHPSNRQRPDPRRVAEAERLHRLQGELAGHVLRSRREGDADRPGALLARVARSSVGTSTPITPRSRRKAVGTPALVAATVPVGSITRSPAARASRAALARGAWRGFMSVTPLMREREGVGSLRPRPPPRSRPRCGPSLGGVRS